LITDGTSRIGQAMAKALLGADASMVMLGIPARVGAGRVDEALAARPDVRLVPLEVTDQTSVAEAATQIGAKVDILINTAFHIRPGGALARHNSITDRDEMDVHYFGLLNLVRAFGPILGSRGADEPRSATAWVSLLSAFALGNWSPLGGSSASFAAAHSALQGLRSDLAGSGVKVITAFFGPTDDEWYDHLQPPKVGPDLIARKIVSALEQGIEQVAAGAIAEDILERWRDNPELLPRELARG
jgi:NAD(P)-dependent dehydrogenase (short-subunit alcohol dehydrogenase family)